MEKAFKEGSVSLKVPERVFYNTEMELCRDLFSLLVGACDAELSVIDAMCASGARGIRYAKENKNVRTLTLVDLSSRAVACAKKNASKNKVKCKCVQSDACKFLFEGSYGKKLKTDAVPFIELDPFGTPQPFLFDSARFLSRRKGGYISITATDMAVLCGAHHAACLKNYAAVPLNNCFCHENAVRILVASIVREFAPFSLSATPLCSFSHRHYIKVLLKVDEGAKLAENAAKQLGFVSFCHKCLWRGARRFPVSENCPHCRNRLEIAGPFYLGALWDGKIVEKAIALNLKRDYAKKKEVEKLLKTILAESKIGTIGYYDLHEIAKKMGGKIRGMDEAVLAVRKLGFRAERTHFRPTAIRTDAPHGRLIKALARLQRP